MGEGVVFCSCGCGAEVHLGCAGHIGINFDDLATMDKDDERRRCLKCNNLLAGSRVHWDVQAFSTVEDVIKRVEQTKDEFSGHIRETQEEIESVKEVCWDTRTTE